MWRKQWPESYSSYTWRHNTTVTKIKWLSHEMGNWRHHHCHQPDWSHCTADRSHHSDTNTQHVHPVNTENKYQLPLIDPCVTKSCCRQSWTISAINNSIRASQLGGIVNLADWWWPSLSSFERPPFLRPAIDMPRPNFLNPEFRKNPEESTIIF